MAFALVQRRFLEETHKGMMACEIKMYNTCKEQGKTAAYSTDSNGARNVPVVGPVLYYRKNQTTKNSRPILRSNFK